MVEKRVTINGKRMQFKSLRQLAKIAEMPYITLYQRIRAGMTPAEAVKQPVRQYRKAA